MIDWPQTYRPPGSHSPIRETWVAIGVGVGGAVVGGIASNRAASKQAKASKGAGQVDITHTNAPWEPSVGARTDLMNRAHAIGLEEQPTFSGWTEAHGGNFSTAAPSRRGGGGGAGKAAGFTGVSPETDQIRADMMRRAEAGNPLYGEAQDYISGNLAGEDQDPYRAETFAAMKGVNDPDLARLKQYLFGQLQGGGGDGLTSGSGGGGGGGSFSFSGGGGGGEPVGTAKYVKDILGEKFLKEGNPYLEKRVQDALDDEQRAFASQVIPGLNSQYAGAGAFGGSMYQQALAQTGEAQARGLAKEANTFRSEDFDKRMQDYMQALEIGAQLDEGAANRSASGAAAAAGAASARDSLNLQRQMGLLSALGGAVGEGVDLKKFGLSGMSDLSGDFSGDQRFALGAVPDITGLGMRDLGAAGSLSLGADQNRSSYDLGRRGISAQAGAARAANDLARQQFNFDVFRDERGYPLMNVGGASDIINALSGGYGTSTEQGLDRRAQSPYTGSVAGSTLSGGMSGALMALQLAQLYGKGGGAGGAAPAMGAGYTGI